MARETDHSVIYFRTNHSAPEDKEPTGSPTKVASEIL